MSEKECCAGACTDDEMLLRTLEATERIVETRSRLDALLREGFVSISSARHCAERAQGAWHRCALSVYGDEPANAASTLRQDGQLISACSYSFRDLLQAAMPESGTDDIDRELERLYALSHEEKNARVRELCALCGWHSRNQKGDDGLIYAAFSPEAALSFEFQPLPSHRDLVGTGVPHSARTQFSAAAKSFRAALDHIAKISHLQQNVISTSQKFKS